MKTRSDFVSNSSSSSFLVAVKFNENYCFDDFVDSIVEQSNKTTDTFYKNSKEFLLKNAEGNRINLQYHLRNSELLFLGALKIGKKSISDVVVPSSKMHFINNTYASDVKKLANYTAEQKKAAADEIAVFSNEYDNAADSRLYSCIGSCIYKITKYTVWNTQTLIDAGYELDFNEQDILDKLDISEIKKLLDDGNNLYCIAQNQGGESLDCKSIYALDGWDSNGGFCDISGFQIIGSKVG